jgi:hypothetical protein
VCQICPTFEGCQRIAPSQIKKRPCPCHLDKKKAGRERESCSAECPVIVKLVLILLIFNAGGRQEGKLTYVFWMIDGAEKSALQMGKFLKQAIAKSLWAPALIYYIQKTNLKFYFIKILKLHEAMFQIIYNQGMVSCCARSNNYLFISRQISVQKNQYL